jgi:hypothetical protein
VFGVAALAVGMSLAFAGVASADSASDDRATFVDHPQGSVTTCDDVGLPDDDFIIGADGNGSDSDANVSGVVGTNTGPIHTGQGEELNVTILGSNVVIDGVVVKGGDGYNLYEDSSVLPPSLQPPQHYIAPFNTGGQVPGISHWFVCYHLSETPTTGSLEISKTVLPPIAGGAVVPTSFNVHVDCDSGDFDVVVSVATPATITGLPDGDICVVTEDESNLPLGHGTPTYTPADANTNGVEIVAGDTPVTVAIHNDFTNVAGESVVAPTPVQAAPAFTG